MCGYEEENGCRHEGSPCRCVAQHGQQEGAPIESADLFAGRKEIAIHHEGQVYRLRLTKSNRLLLNK
jgi:Hemin uptake protein